MLRGHTDSSHADTHEQAKAPTPSSAMVIHKCVNHPNFFKHRSSTYWPTTPTHCPCAPSVQERHVWDGRLLSSDRPACSHVQLRCEDCVLEVEVCGVQVEGRRARKEIVWHCEQQSETE